MSKTEQTAEKPASEQAVLKALAAKPQATAVDIAGAAGLGRSTVSKVLARLASTGEVRRTESERLLPDQFALATIKPIANDVKATAVGDRLKLGQLDGLVLDYLTENADTGPHGPKTVARALNRSFGAVGNCLVRLTRARQVRQDNEKPSRYSLAA